MGQFKISQNICLPITIQASVAFIDCVVLTFPVESLRRGSNRIQVWKPDKQFVYTEYFLKYRLLPNEVLNQLLLRTQIIKIKARSRLHCRNIFLNTNVYSKHIHHESKADFNQFAYTVIRFKKLTNWLNLFLCLKIVFYAVHMLFHFSLIFNAKCQFLIIFNVLTRTGYVSMNIP